MSSAKAALEADTRTLAFEAGRRWGVRVNAISAGPWASRAATAIGFIDMMITYAAANSPLPRPIDADDVGSHRGLPVQSARPRHHGQRGLRGQRLQRDGHGGARALRPSRRMSDELLTQSDGLVRRLTLNRPRRRNALTPDLARELADQLDEVEETGDTELVILAGAEGTSAPASTSTGSQSLGDTTTLRAPARPGRLSVGGARDRSLPGAGHRRRSGTAAGFGLDLAVACDLRIAGSRSAVHLGVCPNGTGSGRRLDVHAAAPDRRRASAAPSARRRDHRCRPRPAPSDWWTRWWMMARSMMESRR